MTAIALNFKPILNLTDEQFFQFCRINRDAKLERTAQGEVLVMAPTGGEIGSIRISFIENPEPVSSPA